MGLKWNSMKYLVINGFWLYLTHTIANVIGVAILIELSPVSPRHGGYYNILEVRVCARGEVAVGVQTRHQNEMYYIRNTTEDTGINRRIPYDFGDIFIMWSITVCKSGKWEVPMSVTDICENGNNWKLYKKLSVSQRLWVWRVLCCKPVIVSMWDIWMGSGFIWLRTESDGQLLWAI